MSRLSPEKDCCFQFQSDVEDVEDLSLYDPFYDVQDNHDLIGVANVFLECLFYDVNLRHQVPVINQQGEVSSVSHHTYVKMSMTETEVC